MAKSVFISLTSELRQYPEDKTFFDAAENAIKRHGCAPIAQPYFAPEEQPAVGVIEEHLGNSDIFVGIIGFKWGSAVRDVKPEISYTEWEFNRAGELGKPRLMFLISKESTVLPAVATMDLDHGKQQGAFRQRLIDNNAITVTWVDNPDNLDAQVQNALRKYREPAPAVAAPAAADDQADPYDDIALQVSLGRVVPFLGPEASLPPEYLPPAMKPRPTNVELLKQIAGRPPSTAELGLLLANFGGYPSTATDSLTAVATYYEAVASDRDLMKTRLHEFFSCELAPRPIHEYLASVDEHLLVMTTNFDDLIEQAFQHAGEPKDFQLIVHPADESYAPNVLFADVGEDTLRPVHPSDVPVDLDRASVIYKMNGSMQRSGSRDGQYVITENDFVDLLGRISDATAIPKALYEPLLAKRLLFIGFDIQLWSTRTLLSRLKEGKDGKGGAERVNRKEGWAVKANPSQLERELWTTQKSRVIDLPIDDFVERLQAAQ